MDTYLNEDEQVQALKRWWSTYGSTIIIAVIIGVSAAFGYQYWQKSTRTNLGHASIVYQQLTDKTVDTSVAVRKKQSEYIIAHFPKTIYASMASLMLANFAVQENDLKHAEQTLTWAIDHAKPDIFKDVARIRKARVLAAMGNDAKAFDLLADVDTQNMKILAANVRGDLLLRQGDVNAARATYEKVLNAPVKITQFENLVNIKLANLNGETL